MLVTGALRYSQRSRGHSGPSLQSPFFGLLLNICERPKVDTLSFYLCIYLFLHTGVLPGLCTMAGWLPTYLCLLSAGTEGVGHHAPLMHRQVLKFTFSVILKQSFLSIFQSTVKRSQNLSCFPCHKVALKDSFVFATKFLRIEKLGYFNQIPICDQRT